VVAPVSYGIDGCRAGWFFVSLDGKRLGWGMRGMVAELVEEAAEDARMLIDIPIGLEERRAARDCDREARRLLGRRRSSVFNPPVRGILHLQDYGAANQASRELCGKAISRQSFNILPKIREVDTLMQASGRARALLREAHPELCFAALNGGEPMQHNKKATAGIDERLAVLRAHLPGAESLYEEVVSSVPRKALARDDILDACVCAVAASRESHWVSLPGEIQRDAVGLPKEIVYAGPPATC
jgi:predicted RNase H-like nuclease